MSAQLQEQAATQSGFLYNARRQLFQSVPPIPANVRLDGKTVLVTGANVGLGLACTRHFLELGAARLIMAVRSISKGEAAAALFKKEFASAQIDVWQLDMELPSSVQAFAARCKADIPRLHVAVLNAGLGKEFFVRTAEGKQRETTLQVNYLSTVLLAVLLLPLMKPNSSESDKAPGRLTLISSDASLGEKLPAVPAGSTILDTMDDSSKFEGYQQYARTKLMLNMFTAKLASDVVSPSEVIINTCNPGATKGTGAISAVQSKIILAVMTLLFAVLGRTPEDAARAYVHASLVLGAESHGSFTDWLVRCWPLFMYGDKGRRATDRLWDETLAELGFANIVDVLKTVKG
ncbi:hypothetical protein SBRCBS47491_008627 [Sporothrix bragantina]|uniref:Short-chain dehydrogenase/reductase family protein n=1 Tax=Sporothrix bragantina TaxID=671064 RepID=A0ABP0CPI9_9PEZI